MKKKLLTLLAIFALSFSLISCSSDDDKDDNPPAEIEKILDSGTYDDGITWKVKMVESFSEEEGKTVSISYGEMTADEKSRMAFGILQQTLNSITTYKILFTFGSKKVTVTEDFWDQCKLAGNTSITVNGAYEFVDEDEGFSSYNLYGSITESSIKQLEQATFIKFEMINSTDEDMDTLIVMPISFQNAMMKYF